MLNFYEDLPDGFMDGWGNFFQKYSTNNPHYVSTLESTFIEYVLNNEELPIPENIYVQECYYAVRSGLENFLENDSNQLIFDSSEALSELVFIDEDFIVHYLKNKDFTNGEKHDEDFYQSKAKKLFEDFEEYKSSGAYVGEVEGFIDFLDDSLKTSFQNFVEKKIDEIMEGLDVDMFANCLDSHIYILKEDISRDKWEEVKSNLFTKILEENVANIYSFLEEELKDIAKSYLYLQDIEKENKANLENKQQITP